MTKRELAAFILKLLGVYAIIRSLPLFLYLSLTLATLGQEKDEVSGQVWTYFSMSVPSILTAIAAIVLLTCSRGLAAAIVREDSDARLSTSLTGEDVQAIGFSVVAVFVFVSAVPQILQFIANLWLIASQSEYGRAPSQLSMRAWGTGLSAAVQLVLAIVLFLRARGLANLWHRIQVGRYVKIDEAEQNAPDKSQRPPDAS
jgi:hypothetical protein